VEVFFIENLAREKLNGLAELLHQVDFVVGVGSGLAMDAAKYLAKKRQISLKQIISTSSNNACFTQTAWTFESGVRIAERNTPIPSQVLLDRDLLKQSPGRLNRAGAAEILCSHTALYDWKLAVAAGRDVQWSDELERFTRGEVETLRESAARIGSNDVAAFIEIIKVGAKFAPRFTKYPKAPFNGGSEHIFCWALEEVSGRRVIHGESVSLGILLMSYLQENQPLEIAEFLKVARVHFQPEEIGVTWQDVEHTMENLLNFSKRFPRYTILDALQKRCGRQTIDKRMREAMKFVERLGSVC